MASININGNIIAGRSINISNGRILVDGKDLTPDSKNITISVDGNIGTLEVDSCQKVDIKGNVEGDVKTVSGDIRCYNVGGNVSAVSGDIKANRIQGNCSTVSGDIENG